MLVREKEVEHMTRGIATVSALVATIGSAVPAHAQGGLSAAVLELARNAPPGIVRPISGERLYGAIVCARIINGNTSTDDFGAQTMCRSPSCPEARSPHLASVLHPPGCSLLHLATPIRVLAPGRSLKPGPPPTHER